LADGVKTKDLGGTLRTDAVTQRVCDEITILGKQRAFLVSGSKMAT